MIEVSARRRECLRSLARIVEGHPGIPICWLVGRFAVVVGLKEDTVRRYLKELSETGLIYTRQGRLYPRGVEGVKTEKTVRPPALEESEVRASGF